MKTAWPFRVPLAAPSRGASLLFLVLLAFLGAAPAWASPAGSNDAWLEKQPRLQTLRDHAVVDRLLVEVQRRFPDLGERLRALVLLRLDTPYVLGCLGEEKPPDTKPVFRLDQVDCTVYVLTTTALAHATSYKQARAMMRVLNYHPVPAGQDPVTYANRVHFTYDRLTSSPHYAIVTAAEKKAGVTRSVTLTLNRKQDGTRLLPIPWERRVTARYIPTSAVSAAVLATLPRACAGIAFVRKKYFEQGLVVAHEGFVIDRRDLVHADSVAKKARRVDLLDYLRRNADWFDGVIFYAIR